MGHQYPLTLGKDEFALDILFHNTILYCYVVVDLKTKKFIPEYTEKMNFYLSLVDEKLKTFRLFAKNPPIAKVFREIGFTDELGSGMRNSYKYTKIYSGGEPIFTEADVFTTIIPLSEAATAMVGPSIDLASREQDKEQVKEQDKEQVTIQDLIQFCSVPRSRKEMQEFMGLVGRRNFSEKYIKPLLSAGKIEMTVPDKPNSRNQKYQKVNSEGIIS